MGEVSHNVNIVVDVVGVGVGVVVVGVSGGVVWWCCGDVPSFGSSSQIKLIIYFKPSVCLTELTTFCAVGNTWSSRFLA